jgi:hypothetical protein
MAPGAEPQAAVVAVFRILLDQELRVVRILGVSWTTARLTVTRWAEKVEVLDPQLGELAPAQPAVDAGLHQQAGHVVGQVPVEGVELVRGDDPQRLARHGRRLHALARV